MPDWVRRLRLWKRRRELQRNSDHIYHTLESDVIEADTQEKRRDVESLRQFFCAQFDEEILGLDSRALVARAKRLHIEVSDLGLPQGHDDHWILGVHGAWFLHPKSLEALSRMVEEAEYQRPERKIAVRDFWWKAVVAIAAVVAAIASLLNLARQR